VTSGGPTSLKKALTWYYGEEGPVYFKNASAGYYKGIENIRPALPGIFEEVLGVPGLIFQINTLGGPSPPTWKEPTRIALSLTWASLRLIGDRTRTRQPFERR
jgi:hypothetical protein